MWGKIDIPSIKWWNRQWKSEMSVNPISRGAFQAVSAALILGTDPGFLDRFSSGNAKPKIRGV